MTKFQCLLPLLALCVAVPTLAQSINDPVNPAPTSADWQAIARLPDWSGTWSPDVADQN
ncbi:MAG: hypothetical protein JWL66_1365, partial [Sphingomonadales bacterium]|nr:hypothetical protein [Sphingomonadales bacterium]